MTQSTVEHLERDVVNLTDKTPIRVLHIDDETGFLKVAKQILEMQGDFQVDTASSIEEAIEKLEKKTYDAVVCDYVMPGKDGLKFLKELRDNGNDIPFIIFTGKGREKVAIKALNLGADQYLNKVGNPETVYSELAHGIRKAVERKRADRMLRESEAKFRNLAEQSPNMIFINKKGRVVYANKKCEEVMGYKREEFYSPDFDFYTLIAPEFVEEVKSNFSRHMKGKEVSPLEYALITKEGRRIEAILTTKLIQYEGESAVLGIVTDITERKKREEEFRLNSLILENINDSIIVTDFEGRITFWNDGASKIFGFSAEEMLGETIAKVCKPEEREQVALAQLEQIRKGVPFIGEWEGVRKNGEPVWLMLTTKLLKNSQGKTIGMIGIGKDITERKKAEEKTRKARDDYLSITNLTGDIIVHVDKDGRWTFLNDCACEFWGKPREKLLGVKFADYLHPDDVEKTNAAIQQGIRTKQIVRGVVNRQKTPKGWRTVEWNGAPLFDKEGNYVGFQATGRDITEQKKAEEALRRSQAKLRRSEEQYRNLYESIMDPVAVFVGREGRLINYNKPFKKLCGYTDEELKNKTFLDFVHPDYHALVLKRYRTKYPEEKLPLVYEIRAVNKKGEVIPIEISVSTYKMKGKVVGIEVIQKDITKRKRAENALKESMQKLETLNEKLVVVGKLTRHDARNKLSTITMNTFMAKQKLPRDHEVLKHLDEIELAVSQVERIFDFARIYERLGVEELVYTDMAKTFEEATMLFSDLHSVKVANNCKGLTVLADSLLRQLFYNLIDNSLKHGKKVSQIRVYYKEHGKDELKLVYEDDGVGIPKTEKNKIFREGYGKDSGYGLSLIRKMCEVYGWTIKETGKQGKGAQFTITIPKIGKNGKENYRIRKN